MWIIIMLGVASAGGVWLWHFHNQKWERLVFPGATLRLRYRDDVGAVTERMVTVREVLGRGGDASIEAYCHLRGAERSFLRQRVITFDAVPVADAPVAPPAPGVDESTSRWVARTLAEEFAEKYANEIIVLVNMARREGQMSPRERRMIVDYVKTLDGGSDIAADDLNRCVKGVYAGLGTFYNALRELALHPLEARIALYGVAVKIADTNDMRHDGENSALASMVKLMNLPHE